jgi:hypothetical protein
LLGPLSREQEILKGVVWRGGWTINIGDVFRQGEGAWHGERGAELLGKNRFLRFCSVSLSVDFGSERQARL